MTLDEAIWRETALAESFRRRIELMETTDTKPLERMEQEHRQFAEWLRELKKLRAELKDVYTKGYNEGHEDGYCEALEDTH